MTQLPFKSVLVTGASGFVGKHLVPVLRSALSPLATLDLTGKDPADFPGEGPVVALDLLDAGSVRSLIERVRPDLVVHMAAQSSIGMSSRSASETWASNFIGSYNLAVALAELVPGVTFFFVSTSEVYGLSFNEGPAVEATPLRPVSAYAKSKAATEAMLSDVLGDQARLIIVRPTNHSGVGQDNRFVIPSFAEQLARIATGASEPILHVGNLQARRDFLDVRDIVAAYLAILERSALVDRTIFNISSGDTKPIHELLEVLTAMSGVAPVVELDENRSRPSEVPIAALDSSRLRALTGWKPIHSVDEMLRTVLDEHLCQLT